MRNLSIFLLLCWLAILLIFFTRESDKVTLGVSFVMMISILIPLLYLIGG